MTRNPRMRKAVLMIALLALVAACDIGAPLTLLTRSEVSSCYVAGTTGMLIVDPKAGTAIVQEDMGQLTVPVRWPMGYTGRKSGDQVEVLDTTGHVVARTGQRYFIVGGYDADSWVACVDDGYPPPMPAPS